MLYDGMFKLLNEIASKPEPYSRYTAADMWNDPYISKKMLELHLNEDELAASRPKAFLQRSIAWMIDRFQINSDKRLCDFGCGPGLYTTAFAEQGAAVTGIDFSKRSINYANKIADEKNLTIEYVNEDYLTYTTDKKFDLITMIYCDFTALNDIQRRQLLASFYEKCEDNGFVFLDVYSMRYYESKKEESTFARSSNDNLWSDFWSSNPYYVFTNIHKYEEKNLFLDKYEILEENRTREIFNWIKCYDLESITEELAASGFKVIEHYANVAGDISDDKAIEIAIVAQKHLLT